METQERQYVVDRLVASEDRLLKLTEGLTPEQWNFRETPQRWSIAENVEHCILVENAIAAGIGQALAGPKQLEKKAAALAKDPYAKGASDATGRKIEAMESLQPTSRWPDTAQMLDKLRQVRAFSLRYARETEDDLRDHFFPHQALGDLDCYQWMVIMSEHGERHARQIEQVKRDSSYPA